MRIPSFLNNDEKLSQRKSENTKSLLGAVATIGLGGFAGNQLLNTVGEAKKILENTGKKGESREVGEAVGEALSRIKSISEESRKINLDRFVQDLNNRLDDILDASSSVSLEERKTFFMSLFDSVRNEQLAGGTEETDDLIRKAYDDISTLNNDQKGALRDLFDKQIKGNEDSKRFFRKSYQKYEGNMHLFESTSRGKNSPFGLNNQSPTFEKVNDVGNFLRRPGNNKLQTRWNEMQGLLKGAENVELVTVNEGKGGIKGVYARFGIGGTQQSIVLRAGTNAQGLPIIRGGESLDTKYVPPLKVMNSPAYLDTMSLRSVNAGGLTHAQNKGIIHGFEDMVFNVFKEGVESRGGTVRNLTGRDFSAFNAFISNFTEYLPNMSGGDSLQEGLSAAMKHGSSSYTVYGLEQYPKKKRKEVIKTIMQSDPENFGTVSHAHTQVQRYQHPFISNKQLEFGTVSNIGSTSEESPFRFLKIFGMETDRALQPQTAREYQMIGRREVVADLRDKSGKSVGAFGKQSNINPVAIGGSNFVGVDPKHFGSSAGLNLGGIIFKGSSGAKLGLAEGQIYTGGNIFVDEAMPKSTFESGLADTKLQRMLIDRFESGLGEIKVGKNLTTDISTGIYSEEDFFREYAGKEGSVILGHNDTGFSEIKRQGGLDEFSLKISGMQQSRGRRKYSFEGRKRTRVDNSKMFGFITKDTGILVNEAQMLEKLKLAGIDQTAFEQVYKTNMGGNVNATLMGTDAQLSKSAAYVANFMAGGLKMAGGDLSGLETKASLILGDESNRLSMINRMYGTSYSSYKDVSKIHRRGVYLRGFGQALVEQGLEDNIDKTTLGHILGSLEGFKDEKKFGMQGSFFDEILDTVRDDADRATIRKAAESNVAYGMTYTTTGGVHSELKRNLARMEPRGFNYLYASLRHNFNLNQEEATKYMSGLASRQVGGAEKRMALQGITMTQMSLSNLDALSFNKMFSSMGNIETMSAEDTRKLFSYGQGQEEEVVKLLSQQDKGYIVNLEHILPSNKKVSEIKKALGGRTSIYLPGREALESFAGFKIKGPEETMSIEGEYKRSLTDLVSALSGVEEATTDEQLANRMLQFNNAKGYLASFTGKTIRQSLSGEVLGSGTYFGQGISFGATSEEGTLIGSQKLKGLEEAFNKKKGYVIFQDAQGFLDGMTSYKEAMRKQLQGEGIKDENVLNEISEKETRERIRNFFLGHHGDYGDTRAMVMRHPNIFLTHYLPEMNIMRYDYTEGAQDDFFKVFASGRVLTADGRKRLKRAVDAARYDKLKKAHGGITFKNIDEYVREKRNYQIKVEDLYIEKDQISRSLGIRYKGIDGKMVEKTPGDYLTSLYYQQKEDKYKLIKERKALQARRRGLRDKYYGEIERNTDGSIVYEDQKVSKNRYIKVKEKEINLKNKELESLNNKRVLSLEETTNKDSLEKEIEKLTSEIEGAKNDSSKDFTIQMPKRMGPEFSTGNAIKNLRKRIADTNEQIERAKQTLSNIYDNKKQLAEKRRKDVHDLIIKFNEENADKLNINEEKRTRLKNLSNIRKKYIADQEKIKIELQKEINLKHINHEKLKKRKAKGNRRTRGKNITALEYYSRYQNDENKLKELFDEDDLNKIKEIENIQSRLKQIKSYGDTLASGKITSPLTKTMVGDYLLNDIFGESSRESSSTFISDRIGKFNNQFNNMYDVKSITQEIKKGSIKEKSYYGYGNIILALFKRKKTEEERRKGLDEIKKTAKKEMENDILEQKRRIAREKLIHRKEFIQNMKSFFGIDLEANPELILDRRKFIDSLKPQNPNNEGKRSSFLQALLRTYDPDDSTLSAYKDGDLREAVTQKGKINALIQERNELQTRLKTAFEGERTSIQEKIEAKQKEIDEAISPLVRENVEGLRTRRNEIKLELEELRKNNPFFHETFMLDSDEYNQVKEDFKLNNPDVMKSSALINIENETGVSINSFEDVHKVLQSHGSTSVTYRTAEGDKTGTVSEVIDKMFMRMAARHKTSGEQGGGKLFFPQLDVKGTLTAGGKDFAFSERIDFSRIMVGDFDADYYQVFHSTARNANSGKFMSNAAQHFGLYNSGAEYIFSKQLLGEGMKKLGERLGVSNMGLGETVIDEFTKEQIIKDVGGLDVQVKIGMLGMIKSMEESVAEGNTKQHASRMRSSASLVAMAQEVLAIKGKSLPTAAGVADQFAESLKKSYSTGNADYLFDFFQQHIFKDTILESGEDIIVKDMQIQNLNPGMETKNLLESELKTTRVSMSTFREDLQAMVSSVKKYGYQSLGSDARSGKAFMSGDVASLKLFGRMLNASAEGGMFNFDGSVQDMDRLEKISNATDQILNMDFLRTPRGKGIGGLAAGVLAGSYILGASAGISSLEPSSDKFSDMRSKESIGSGHLSSMFQNRDHMSSKAALSGMGMDSYQRPINTGETSVHIAKSARMYGEAPTYSQAMGSAQRFVSAGGQAYLGIQDNRMPISNSYINKSLRD